MIPELSWRPDLWRLNEPVEGNPRPVRTMSRPHPPVAKPELREFVSRIVIVRDNKEVPGHSVARQSCLARLQIDGLQIELSLSVGLEDASPPGEAGAVHSACIATLPYAHDAHGRLCRIQRLVVKAVQLSGLNSSAHANNAGPFEATANYADPVLQTGRHRERRFLLRDDLAAGPEDAVSIACAENAGASVR